MKFTNFRHMCAVVLVLALALSAPLRSLAATSGSGGGFDGWWNRLSPTTRNMIVFGGALGLAAAIGVLASNPATMPLAASLAGAGQAFLAGAAAGAVIGLVRSFFGAGGSSPRDVMSGGGSPTLLGLSSR